MQRLVTNLFKATTPKEVSRAIRLQDTAASMLLLALIFLFTNWGIKEGCNKSKWIVGLVRRTCSVEILTIFVVKSLSTKFYEEIAFDCYFATCVQAGDHLLKNSGICVLSLVKIAVERR